MKVSLEMDDDDDVVVKKKRTTRVKSRVESDDEDERDDEIDMEFDVVVCNELPNTELYRVHFPVRKKDAFEQERQPRVRYKKNVRMMEMRLSADTSSGSYDKTKAERFAAMTSSNVKQENAIAHSKFDEIYEGRAYRNDDYVQFAVGYFRGDTFYMSPVAGTFEMHRSLSHLNNASRGRDDDGDDGESDSEAAGGSAQQIRVKFSRPETEKQKKRREASALHREKLIASDSWIPMEVHLKEDPLVVEKFSQMTVDPTVTTTEEPGSSVEMNTRDLVEQGIVCGEKEQIDLTRSDLLVSQQRIREMPAHHQVKAQVLKSRVITTDDVMKRVDSSLTREEIIEDLKQCARLVQGVWVLNSNFLFYDLTVAHSNTPGKIDEHRAELWRAARDLALYLIDACQPVTRALLTKCFQINSKDAEDILSTFAVPGNKTWKLRILPDPVFLESACIGTTTVVDGEMGGDSEADRHNAISLGSIEVTEE
ncbi:Sin-like protein region [Ancylostoma duodenale]|uniref:Sin-like protein region n=1 Tax=Ancylostoma duodenale TaxID=51022 RepID=A0A0C2BTY9_9BILA|nr:Sin-like protein region [Ancylostoma duodenale]